MYNLLIITPQVKHSRFHPVWNIDLYRQGRFLAKHSEHVLKYSFYVVSPHRPWLVGRHTLPKKNIKNFSERKTILNPLGSSCFGCFHILPISSA